MHLLVICDSACRSTGLGNGTIDSIGLALTHREGDFHFGTTQIGFYSTAITSKTKPSYQIPTTM